MVGVSFKINGKNYLAGEDIGPHVTVNDFIRKYANLKGTKKMCAQGGCGCCVAQVTYSDPNSQKKISRSINTCMLPIYSCDGWEITTIEGLGNQHTGYHTIQKRLAEFNGTQCGFCSPGFVMTMYGLLANDPNPTKQKIEDSFDGNICRCTGYRPILDAMKSFAHTNDNGEIPDIEDVNKACCGKRGYTVCNNSCKEPEKNNDDCSSAPNLGTKILNNYDGIWMRPHALNDCLALLKQMESKKVRLVVGNTGTGIFKYEGPYDYYIDIGKIPELHEIDSTLSKITFGASVTLTQLMEELKLKSTNGKTENGESENSLSAPSDHVGWEYCQVLADHISHIANSHVRNAGCWAGNLKMKYDHNDFASDLFTIMETAGAIVTVVNYDGTTEDVTPAGLMKLDMKGKMLVKLQLNQLNPNHIMRTFKITIRSQAQNSEAYINAGFLFEISKTANFKVTSKPSIVFGGVNKNFVHATEIETLLTGAELGDPETVKYALVKLESEIQPEDEPALASVAYRKSLCVSLLYKFILGVIGNDASAPYRSGAADLERPISGGKQTIYTNETEWPLTKPIPKLEALIQCSGEAQYSGDRGKPGQLYASYVPSSTGNATLKTIDTEKALAIPGVVKVIVAENIPGVNNLVVDVPGAPAEEVLASTRVNYQGQPIAIVLAETEYIAEKGAKLVTAEYTNIQKPIIDIKEAIEKKSFWDLGHIPTVISGNVEEGFKASDKVFEGEIATGAQYHFHLETQSAFCAPSDVGLDVHCATQSANFCQASIAKVLGIQENEINLTVKRVGGAYGAKLMRSVVTATGCALAAHLTNRPVLMHLPMETNMRMIGKRLPYLAKYKVGVTNEGKLNAVHITYYNDAGSSPIEESGSSVINYGDSGYYCQNWKLDAFCVKTNTPTNTSCRAPAWLQGATFIDSILEDVAYHLELEPIDVKAQNLIKDGQKKAGGQVISHCLLDQMVDEFKEMSEFCVRKNEIEEFNKVNQWKKKGLSCVMMRYPYSYAYQFNSTVSIYGDDGTVAISHGGIEMGQGINTKAAQVCGHTLGIPLSMIKVKPTNSMISPNQMLTGGSMGSDLVAYATIKACEILNCRMAPIKEKLENPTWLQLVKECRKEAVDLCARNEYSRSGGPESYDIYGMTATEIELDVLTGMVQIPRVDILYDGGNSLSPDVDVGQIEGAFVMGLGLMLTEQMKYDPSTGELLTRNTLKYKPPASKDIPIQFNVKFLRNARNPLGVLGSKATGEPPLCMSGSALFAVRDAIQSARKDAGDTQRIFMAAPATPEFNHNSCLVSPDRMKIY